MSSPTSSSPPHLPGTQTGAASLSSHSLPGADDVSRVQLPNGIVILSRSNFNSPFVVISGYLHAGSIFDPTDKLGLADFTATALMRGTQQRTFQQIYTALENVGASLGIGGSTHTAGFSGKALTEDLDLLLSLLAEALRNPVFPSKQVERLRAQLLTGLSLRAQDTGEMASLAFDKIVYKDHPYSNPEDGYPETIEAIQQADLAAFHRRHYGPSGLVIAVVGAIEAHQVVEKAAQVLGDWQNPDQPDEPDLPPVKPLRDLVTTRVDIAGKSQADIVIGTAGPMRRSPDFLAASLGNSVLGQFGLMGRIGEVLREETGLAYYASSSLSGGVGPGPWDIGAGVAPQNIEQATALIMEEIRRFVGEPVSDEELADSQTHFIGSLPLSLESNAGVAAALISLERHQLGLDYYRRYADLVQAVTPEQILEAARHYLEPQRLCIAIAGP